MDVKELKKELSKLTGIDFFNPKYRNVFKRYSTSEKDKEAEDDVEAESANTQTENTETAATEETAQDTVTGNTESEPEASESEDFKSKDIEASEDTEKEPEVSQNTDTEDVETGKPEESKETDGATQEEDASEPNAEEVKTEEEATDQSVVDMGDELLNTKLELELVRAGIREDRLETAKRLFMPEFKASGGNVEQLKELISQYPEWITKQGGAQGFGMPLGDKADALTNEEKALKRMGIDPRT